MTTKLTSAKKTPAKETPAQNATLAEDLIEDLETEISDDINVRENLDPLVVASRDWTVETIVRQISLKNIDLNPKFQRRNAWNDAKRSVLIESLIWGVPIPEIVLAEDPSKPRSFIVIDGKQRLLTIAGFIDPTIKYWDSSSLKGLKVFSELNNKSAEDLETDPLLEDFYRRLMNADIRCTVLSNYSDPDILYDIFYRINTGSVRLGSQELRQVLHRGWFADFLVEKTNTLQPLHYVLGLTEPDVRLADIEIILRCLSMSIFAQTYRGNLKQFLDDAMRTITSSYSREKIEDEYSSFNEGIAKLTKIFPYNQIGRKSTKGKFESRFNRVLFEVENYFFKQLPTTLIAKNKTKFINSFVKLNEDKAFRASIETTTKSVENTQIRYKKFQSLIKDVFGKVIPLPF